MKKIKLWVLGVLLTGFAGCLPPEAKQKKSSETSLQSRYESTNDLSAVTVGYCTPTLDGPFYMALEVAVKEAVQSYGMKYISTDGQGDINKQVMAVEDLLSKNIQVLILNPL